jgi:hypothetical protein
VHASCRLAGSCRSFSPTRALPWDFLARRVPSADRLEVDEREEVEAAHARCVERGDNVHFPPEEDREIEGYYAFFVFDPDGMRIEVLSWPR